MLQRRDFFRLGARKAARIGMRMAAEKLARRAANWIRPPFAEDELDFLLDCTRCDKCIEACPHDVLFRLPARLGLQVVGTPAMDLRHHGCHMCADWPCVNACETGALKLPDPGGESPPAAVKLAQARVDPSLCLAYLGPECGACAHACPIPGALEWVDGLKPVVNQDRCTGCALCREACIVDPKAIEISALRPEQPD